MTGEKALPPKIVNLVWRPFSLENTWVIFPFRTSIDIYSNELGWEKVMEPLGRFREPPIYRVGVDWADRTTGPCNVSQELVVKRFFGETGLEMT
jgi:hypothetical protein